MPFYRTVGLSIPSGNREPSRHIHALVKLVFCAGMAVLAVWWIVSRGVVWVNGATADFGISLSRSCSRYSRELDNGIVADRRDGLAALEYGSSDMYRPRWTAHSSGCSIRMAPIKRVITASFGKMPTTPVRRLISPFSCSMVRVSESPGQ